MKNINCSILLIAGICTSVIAQTNISGGIYTNTTWTAAGSPYIVSDSLVLFQGVTLVIEPGVTVKFNDDIEFEVRGTLNAIGTPTDSVVFTSSSTTPNRSSWDGIYFYTDLGASIQLTYCKLEYATMPIRIGFSSNPLPSSITNSTFQNNGTCIGGYAGQDFLTVDNCTFKKNTYGIGQTSWAAGHITPRNCVFTDNEIGIYYTQSVNPINCIFCNNNRAIAVWGAVIDSCTIINNVVGIDDIHPYDGLEVSNSIVAFNDTGIVIDDGSASGDVFTNVKICSNRNFNVVHTGNYNLSMDNVCWCDTNTNVIAQKIYDGYDNSNIGLVAFSPLVNCDSTVLSGLPVCPVDSNITGLNVPTFISDQLKVFPNPFSGLTNIHFNIEQLSLVTLDIYDINGRRLDMIINNQRLTPGVYSYVFDGYSATAGIYYCRLICDEKAEVKKIMVIHEDR